MTVNNPRRTDLIQAIDTEIRNQFKGSQEQSLSREDLQQTEKAVNKVLNEYRGAVRNPPMTKQG
jgi:hypothetical protein